MVYTASGTKLVSYTYDAWVNVSSLYHNNGASTAAKYNCFRYRGYFYDEETKLYYLNSRYYDPATGRFINADIFVNANGDLTGFNMFAYCSNNPVNEVDYSGTASKSLEEIWEYICNAGKTAYDWLNTGAGLLNFNPVKSGSATVAVATAVFSGNGDDLIHDLITGALNPFNQDENTAINSKVLGFYKGSLIIRQTISPRDAFSFAGVIVYGTESGGENTLNHEWGHSVQERMLGTIGYIRNIAIPSVAYYWYSDVTDGSLFDYFSMPWERTAEWLGGVNRHCGYKDGSLAWGAAEMVLGPLAILAYALFK